MNELDLCFLYIMLAIIIILIALIVAKIEHAIKAQAEKSKIANSNIIEFNPVAA